MNEKPITGIKAPNLRYLTAGTFAETLLADFGADVVNIEPPGKSGQIVGQGISWSPIQRHGSSGPGVRPAGHGPRALGNNRYRRRPH